MQPPLPATPWNFAGQQTLPEQYLILITCRNEPHQAELLTEFAAAGLTCKPLMS